MLVQLGEILEPALSKCLVMEMCEVFGEVWITMIYRPPPWESLLPILECLNKLVSATRMALWYDHDHSMAVFWYDYRHWMAVYSMITGIGWLYIV